MDAARSTRKYPSYTTAELEVTVAAGVTKYCSAEKIADIAAEVAARKAGISVHRPTPRPHVRRNKMLTIKTECRFCWGNGKIHSPLCENGDPMDKGVDCPECEGTGAVDVDCETGDEVETMPAWLDRKEPSLRTLQRWAAAVSL